MHDILQLPTVVTSLIVNTFSVSEVAKGLKEAEVNNIITINKNRIVLRFKTLTMMIEGVQHTLHHTSTYDEIKVYLKLINKSDLLTIEDLYGRILTYNNLELKAIHGVKLLAHEDLSIEYYRNLLFDILYSTPTLINLCRGNPIDDENSIDLFEALDINSSPSLLEEDVDDITLYLKSIGIDPQVHLLPIRGMVTSYPFCPKKISVGKFHINITIYEDVRTFRFNELLRIQKENNEQALYYT